MFVLDLDGYGKRQADLLVGPFLHASGAAAELEARDLGEARPINQELFRQLVGDTCHARHGLRRT